MTYATVSLPHTEADAVTGDRRPATVRPRSPTAWSLLSAGPVPWARSVGPGAPTDGAPPSPHIVTSMASMASAIDIRQTSVSSGRVAQAGPGAPAVAALATGTSLVPAWSTYPM